MSGVKIGDKVVVVDAQDTGGGYKNGDVAVVVHVYMNGSIDVQFDHYMYDQDFDEHYLYGSEYRVFQQHLVKEGQKTTAEGLKQVILSIQQEREQALYKLKDLDIQEAEAISQLNALGFSLFEEGEVKSSPSKTMLYAEDIEEDMTDPENWKVGDMIRCVNGAGWEHWIDEGEVAEMVKPLSLALHLKTRYGFQCFGSRYYQDFKFHSRPVK